MTAAQEASEEIMADYVLIGSGAGPGTTGMACADVLSIESNATSSMVDECHRPGGRSHVAYPFVPLHQSG